MSEQQPTPVDPTLTPTPTPETTPEVTPTPETTPEVKPETPPVEFTPLTAEALTMPEDMNVDEAARDEFLGILNDREATPAEQAQKLVDLQARLARDASETGSKAWEEIQTDWVSKVKADPDIGGANFENTMTSIGKLVTHYGDQELRDAMNLTGAGNHPAMVKFLAKVAKDFNEGTPISGAPVNTSSALEQMYPSMAKK